MKLQNKTAITGSVIGFLVAWYDFDFFINVGGPETPISDFICRLFGADNVGLFYIFIFPTLVLILIFGLLGLILGFLISKLRS